MHSLLKVEITMIFVKIFFLFCLLFKENKFNRKLIKTNKHQYDNYLFVALNSSSIRRLSKPSPPYVARSMSSNNFKF